MAFIELTPIGKFVDKELLHRQLSLEKPIIIGRLAKDAIGSTSNGLFKSVHVSRLHGIMSYENEQFLLRDTDSSNGTYVEFLIKKACNLRIFYPLFRTISKAERSV